MAQGVSASRCDRQRISCAQRLNSSKIRQFRLLLPNRIGYPERLYAFGLIRLPDGSAMSTFDIIFWVLIVLIGVLAYTIESGLSARHRPLVFSSILSATLAVIYMMFIVEDNSKFGTGKPLPPAPEGKQKVTASSGGEGGGLPQIEVIQEAGPDSLDSVSRYEDGALLKKVGGFRDCPACPLMTVVPQGTVIVGSPADEPNRRSNEGPQKVVRITRAFAVSRYEIQYREFAAFVRASRHSVRATCLVDGKPSRVSWQKPGFEQKTGDHPLVCVSRNDVNAYASLVEKHKNMVFTIALKIVRNREDAEEISQDVFVKAYQSEWRHLIYFR